MLIVVCHFLTIVELLLPETKVYWDIGFIVWGVAMLIAGWALWRTGQQDTTSNMNPASMESMRTR